MNDLINIFISILCYMIILSCYKTRDIAYKYIIVFVLSFICNLLLNKYIYKLVDISIFVLMKIGINFLIIKIIFKKIINVLDIFYISCGFLLYRILEIVFLNYVYVNLALIFITVCLKIYAKSIYNLNCKIINLWDQDTDVSLRLRNSLIIIFNITIFILCKIY